MPDDSFKCTSDLSKEDLLRLLACLQSELEARDVVINALKSERHGLINLKAKYGIISNDEHSSSVVDPYQALHRDSMVDPCRDTCDNSDLRELYDTQLVHLENLITSQRLAQEKMRARLKFMEDKFLKVRGELEEERRKHEHDTAQGDDVLVMLEKERERLKSETQNKTLEKDLKRLVLSWKQQALLLARQKEVAVTLLKERHTYMQQLTDRKCVGEHELQKRPDYVETSVQTAITGDQNMFTREITKGDANTGSACETLLENLDTDIARKHDIEFHFKRLKEDYAKLLEELNSIRSPKLISSTGDSHSATRNSSSCNSKFSVSSTDVDISSPTVTPPRSKPHPPTRRSSEVTNSSSTTVPSNVFIPGVNGVSVEENASIVEEVEQKKVGSTPITTTSDANSPVGYSNRSSTPSPPPPPPPPVQLHYPYPGMQSHLQTRVSAAGSLTTSNSPFFIRPTGGRAALASGVNGRPRAPPPPHPPSLANNSCSLVHRLNSTPPSVRSSSSLTQGSVNFYQPASSFSMTSVTTNGAAFHIKPSQATTGTATPFSQRRASPSPAAQQHTFSALPPQHHFSVYQNRYQFHRHPHQFAHNGGTGSSGANLSSVPSTSAPNVVRAIRSARPSSPPEHICISGK